MFSEISFLVYIPFLSFVSFLDLVAAANWPAKKKKKKKIGQVIF